MSNGMGLQLQQRTDLALTAELRQAIAMLALSATEVQDLVAQEVGDNPCLEFEDHADATPRELVAAEQPLGGESKEADGWQTGTEDGSGQWAVRDEGAGGVLGGDFTTGSGGGGNGQDEDSDGWLNRVANEETLQAHLLRQFEAIVPKGTAEGVRLRVAGYFLIEALDDAGYLRVTVAEVAAQLRLSEDVVDDARAILQTMDPPGIGARDLAECLRLQLHARGQMEVVMEVCLAHLDKVGARDWAGLARLAGTDPEEIRLAVAEIVQCNPKPASAWTAEFGGPLRVESVVPDVLVAEATGDDPGEAGALSGWRVALNGAAFPKLMALHPRDMVGQGGAGRAQQAAQKYIAERHARAKWLIGALEQRASTTLAVAKAALSRQRPFLEAGAEFLQPLTLREVAGAVGVHESTVSRVVSGKFMQTPWGVLPMKMLFASGVASSGGHVGVAAHSVQAMIKRFVAAENPQRPLSDEQLVLALKAEGVDVARRTVAKYRGVLNIPGTAERRVRKVS